MHNADGWDKLTHYQMEAVENIVGQVAEILSCGPNDVSSWEGLKAYAQLVINELKR